MWQVYKIRKSASTTTEQQQTDDRIIQPAAGDEVTVATNSRYDDIATTGF